DTDFTQLEQWSENSTGIGLATYPCHYFWGIRRVSSIDQFRTRSSPVSFVCVVVNITKCLPSGKTSYTSACRPSNSGRGALERNVGARLTLTATIVEPCRKKSSSPLADHLGARPPCVETGILPPPEIGRTYTSSRPDSLELYAMKRLSGEKPASFSSAAVVRNG